MAYKVELRSKQCARCNTTAKYEVFNYVNGSMGYFCFFCARKEVARLEEKERAPNPI